MSGQEFKKFIDSLEEKTNIICTQDTWLNPSWILLFKDIPQSEGIENQHRRRNSYFYTKQHKLIDYTCQHKQ